MRNKLLVSALLSAVSGLTLMQGNALANDATVQEDPKLEFCQYKLADPLHIEDPNCINVEPAGAPYSS